MIKMSQSYDICWIYEGGRWSDLIGFALKVSFASKVMGGVTLGSAAGVDSVGGGYAPPSSCHVNFGAMPCVRPLAQ